MRPSLETTGLPAFLTWLCLILQFSFLPAKLLAGEPPAGAVVKVTEYTLVNGQRIGVQEWSTVLAAVPCEVQGNTKAAPCSKCDSCTCGSRTGGCPCEAKATTPAKAEPAAVRCQFCGAGCTCFGRCGCDAYYAEQASRQARPGRVAGADPTPIVVSAPPVVYSYPPAGGWYQGAYYQAMPTSGDCANGQCSGTTFSLTGPLGGGIRYGTGYGATSYQGGR